jgi:hypothetical protein
VHTLPAVHACVHEPQFARSVLRSRHVPPQFVRPEPHEVWQCPIEHTSPAMQAVLHAPQLARSDARSTHEVPQRVSPAGHTMLHAPPTQLSPVAHARPHVPQFIGSVCTSAQYARAPVGVHTMSVPQLVSQWPMLQTIPVVQAFVQLPQ